jgi:hypothetical protein
MMERNLPQLAGAQYSTRALRQEQRGPRVQFVIAAGTQPIGNPTADAKKRPAFALDGPFGARAQYGANQFQVRFKGSLRVHNGSGLGIQWRPAWNEKPSRQKTIAPSMRCKQIWGRLVTNPSRWRNESETFETGNPASPRRCRSDLGIVGFYSQIASARSGSVASRNLGA